MRKYPHAVIRQPFPCASCGIEVNSTASKTKYCKPCGVAINYNNVVLAVRKANRKRKRLLLNVFIESNREFGRKNSESRLDKTHAEWDNVYFLGFKRLGNTYQKDVMEYIKR
jgi:hypothetical protein